MPDSAHPKSSTADLKNGQFRPHGVVDIWMEGPLLHYEARGPFNNELFDLLAIAQREFLKNAQPQGPWVSICNVVNSAMTSPEGAVRYQELLVAPKPPNMVPLATAFVLDPAVEGSRIMGPMFLRIFSEIGRKFALFETMAEAKAWAMAQIEQARAANSQP